MTDATPIVAVDEQIRELHAELRKTRPGRLTVFFGAGASYDYGIPTMTESAEVLRKVLAGGKSPVNAEFSKEAQTALKQLTAGENADKPVWDIEQLLTRLYQLQDVVCADGQRFAVTKASIGGKELTQESIKAATSELLKFHVEMCQLTAPKHTGRGAGSIQYLADFIRLLSRYDHVGLRLFTINIDVCIEAAVTALEHRPARHRRPGIRLVDGFGTSIVPVFDIRNFKTSATSEYGGYPVYLWKLHGSVDWRFSLCHGAGDQPADAERIVVRRYPEALACPLKECGALQEDPPDSIVVYPTPAKYSQTYTYPYMELFETFRFTMENTDTLLVVGTSFPDLHIRAAVKAFAHRDDTKLYVVDPRMEQSTLVELFEDVPTLQPVIKTGLKDLVDKLKAVDASETTTATT